MWCGAWQGRVAAVAVLTLGWFAMRAEDAQRSHFDLPADTIERSIKQFAMQSGLEVLVAVDTLPPKLKTRAVRGRMTPWKALEAMLVGSGLTVVMDPKTRALAVRRASAASPESTSADATSTERGKGTAN